MVRILNTLDTGTHVLGARERNDVDENDRGHGTEGNMPAMHDTSRIPSYRDLPIVEGMPSGWGLFGPDDSRGRMNLHDPASVVAASRLVRRGAVFPLDAPIGSIEPPFFQRDAVRHTVWAHRPRESFEDAYDNLNPQSGSQWDALGHVAIGPDMFYNGVTSEQILRGERNTIRDWGRTGIVARGVLVDVADLVLARGGPGARVPITADDLRRALDTLELELGPGDVLLFHTGFLDWHARQSLDERRRLSQRDSLVAPGLEQSESMAEFLWDAGVAGVATDTAAVEAWPPDRSDAARPFGFLHRVLIASFGMALGEQWWLRELAADCAADGVAEFMLVSVPLQSRGVASPANVLAIK